MDRAADLEPARATAPRWRGAGRPLVVLVGVALVALALLTPAGLAVLPVLLALFPASLLRPAQRWLIVRGVPAALGAALLTATAVTALVTAGAVAVPMLVAQLPMLVDSLAVALRTVMGTVDTMPIGVDAPGIDALLERGTAMLAPDGDRVAQAAEAVDIAGEVIAAAVLVVVVLFFYLKDGPRIAAGLRGALPQRWQPHATELGVRSWATLGAFFRGQLLVALVEAAFIGLGLLLLGIPLALPLTLLVFLGGLLPIVGAIASGAIAVLIALADGGIWVALAVLAIVVAVQQLESNVLQPFVMGRMTALHPLLVILAITFGWATVGVLGAFLAVPVAACAARSFDYLREISPSWRQSTSVPSGSDRQSSPSLEASST